MALVNLTADDVGTWSAGIALTSDTPVQCKEGTVRVAWTAGAPASTDDGLDLHAGSTIVIPSGSVLRWTAATSVPSTLFHASFP